MNKNIIEKSLNKGVPVNTTIDIKLVDLVEISDEKSILSEQISKQFTQYMMYLASLGVTSDIEYITSMSAIIDEDTLERKLIFSFNGYFSTLFLNLNLDNILNNLQENKLIDSFSSFDEIMNMYEKPLKNRIEILKQIKSDSELKKDFPLLYNKFKSIEKDIKQRRNILVKINKLNGPARNQLIKTFEKEQQKLEPEFKWQTFLKDTISFNIKQFIKNCSQTLTSLIDNYHKIIEYIYTHPIDLSNLPIIDQNKLELYLAFLFLERAEMVSEDQKQDFLYYVSSFFAEHKDILNSNVNIKVGNTHGTIFRGFDLNNKDGYVITPTMLYDKYRQLLIKNPNLRSINFSHLDFTGMKASEVKQFMDEYLKDLSAHWEFLEPDNKEYEKETLEKIKNSGKQMSQEKRIAHQNKLLELFMQKKDLYDSSDPFFRVKGKGTFNGYIGFIYPNGRVILDKFYDDADDEKIAENHAIYAMGIQEFYELSKLSKTAIIRNKLCNRYIHKGNWVQRVLENEILAQGTINPSVEIQKIIKNDEMTAPDEYFTKPKKQ